MKKHLFIISALFFSVSGFTQGIVFEHGTWKEALVKAHKTHKPIFLDVSTSWCGHCITMSKQVFPLQEVGKEYNANFICYRIDAEKGEGIEIARKYNVAGYPTYLFIDADETVFYTTSGSMEVKDFIAESRTALSKMHDYQPIAIWEKEYPNKKNDPAFLLDYMDKRSKRGMSNALVFDEYLGLLPQEELTSTNVVELYKKEGQHMRVNSVAYANLRKNRTALIGKLFGQVDHYLYGGILNTMDDAAESKNEQLLASAIAAYDQLPKNTASGFKEEIYMEYYKKTGEKDQYLKYIINFGNNRLMSLSDDSLAGLDSTRLQLMEKNNRSELLANKDSTNRFQVMTFPANMEKNRIGDRLNNIAWIVFETVSDKGTLEDALLWSKRSLELCPNRIQWLDTYANLLYKLGQKEEAIAKEEEALSYAQKNNFRGSNGIKETILKMKAGVKTWE